MIKKIIAWWKHRKLMKSFMAGNWILMATKNKKIYNVRKKDIWGDTYLDYQCPDCKNILMEGPCGGGAVNAVCHNCKINFGCLPGFDFPINLAIFDNGGENNG